MERTCSMESGLFGNLFEKIFNGNKSKEPTEEEKFTHGEQYLYTEKLYKIFDKTVFKSAWAEKNIDEVISFKVSNKTNEYLCIADISDEEFLTADDLLKSLKKVNKWLEDQLKDEVELLKLTSAAFKDAESKLKFLENSSKRKDEEELEDLEKAEEITKELQKKHRPKIDALEQKINKDKSTKKFSDRLHLNNHQLIPVLSDEVEFKMARDELVKFLKESKDLHFDPDEYLREKDEVPYWDSDPVAFMLDDDHDEDGLISLTRSGELMHNGSITIHDTGPLNARSLFDFVETAVKA